MDWTANLKRLPLAVALAVAACSADPDGTTTALTGNDATSAASSGDPSGGGASDGGGSTGGPEPLCLPGTFSCDGDDVLRCNGAGDAWEVSETCDGVQGITCNEALGECVGLCDPSQLGASYIGCDYYPTVTANLADEGLDFAVAVSNTSDFDANVTVTQGDNTLFATVVPPHAVETIALPWVSELKFAPGFDLPTESVLVPQGAFRLRTDQPVTVYQYAPVDWAPGGGSADASLLLPVTSWGTHYTVAAQPTWQFVTIHVFEQPGLYAVVAAEDDTVVDLAPSTTGREVLPGGGVGPEGTGSVTLNAGDVLQVFSAGNHENPSPADLTGTQISASKPVQVISGHICTMVPYDNWACDHLEEALFPTAALGKRYLATAPLTVPEDLSAPFINDRMIRVIAAEDDVDLTYEPNPGGLPAHLDSAGDWVEIGPLSDDLYVEATKKVEIAQYMLGQTYSGDVGDPSMTLSPPMEQFRSRYRFHAPPSYLASFINVVRPAGVDVQLDGETLSGFSAIGASGYEVLRHPLLPGESGDHLLEANEGIGLTVYGYGEWASYWYPGGVDLAVVP